MRFKKHSTHIRKPQNCQKGIKMCSNIARQIRSDNGARQEDKLTGCFTNDGALHPTSQPPSQQQQKVQWQILFFVLILIGSISIYGCQFSTERERLKWRKRPSFIGDLPRDLFWTWFEILIHYHLKGIRKRVHFHSKTSGKIVIYALRPSFIVENLTRKRKFGYDNLFHLSFVILAKG